MKKQQNHEEKFVRYTESQIKKLKDKTDYSQLDNTSDADIDYSEIPKTDHTFWAEAKVEIPRHKKAISIRIDEDVLNWFKHEEGHYQRLINRVLRKYMDAHR